MRVETHQRRIRKALAKLNALLADAKIDNVYVNVEMVTSSNNDQQPQEINIRDWELDEPGNEQER